MNAGGAGRPKANGAPPFCFIANTRPGSERKSPSFINSALRPARPASSFNFTKIDIDIYKKLLIINQIIQSNLQYY
jgi:hypothetical protein